MNTDDNERWANTMLADALGSEPELGFHADDVLTRARRDRSRRRASITGIATVVTLAATGLLLGHGGAQRHPVLAGKSPFTATTVQGYGGDMIYNAHAATLTAGLADAHLIPPGIHLSIGQDVGGEPLVFYKLVTGQYADGYLAQATLTDEQGPGHLVVYALPRSTGVNCVGAPSSSQPCTTTILADGNRLTTMHYAPPQSGKPAIQWIVELVRPDGTAVDVLCGNWSMDGDKATSGTDHATGAEPPIGIDTLVRIAELGLRP